MKLAKLSLAALTVVGLSSNIFAADSLSDAFKNGKVSGALQAYYFNRDNGVNSEGITDLGVDLSYKTDSFNGLSAGFTFQGTYAPWVTAAEKVMFNGDMYGSGAVLSEAYLNYANSGAFLKIGRQYISTPLVAGSGSRITKQSFEGYVAGYTGIENLTLVAGYVSKFQNRTDGNGNIGKFQQVFDGAYTFLVAYKAKEFSVNAQYAAVKNVVASDDIGVYYIDGTYKLPMDSVNIALSAQYGSSNGVAGLEGDVLGVKVAASMGDFYGHIAYNTNDNSDITVPGLGGGADWAYAGGLIYGNNYAPDVDTIGLGLGYKIAGADLSLRYSDYNTGAANIDYNTLGFQAKYALDGALKGLGLLAQYDRRDFDNGFDQSEFRFKANYKF